MIRFTQGPSRRATLALAIGAVVLFACAAGAQAKDALKVGFVDLDQVIRQSRYIRGVVGAIDKQAREIQSRIDQNMGKYQRMAAELQKQRSVLSDQQVDEREKELKELRSQTQDLGYELDKLLKESKTDALNPALEKAMDAVKAIGKDEGYDLILTGENVLFAAKSVNLTDRVVERLDREVGAEAESKGPTRMAPALAD